MNAADIMTAPVVTIEPGTPIAKIAALLDERHISGVPVVAEGKVVGMVSEGDLLRRHEIGTDRPPRAGWRRLLDPDRMTRHYVRSHARYAADVMSRPVISVTPETPLPEIVSLFEKHGIRRVPVVRDGQLVGIVSRADLVRRLATRARRRAEQVEANDEVIRARLLAELAREPWWERNASNVIVSNGVVHFWGLVESEIEREAARVAAENVPGVRRVVDHRLLYNSLPSML